MPTEDYQERVINFIEQLNKLHYQLSKAQEQQKIILGRMLEIKEKNQTDLPEYDELCQRSKGLQAIIDKWRPIYLERLQMVKDVKASHR